MILNFIWNTFQTRIAFQIPAVICVSVVCVCMCYKSPILCYLLYKRFSGYNFIIDYDFLY